MKQRVFNILILLAVCGLGTLQYLDYTSSKDGPKDDLTDVEVVEVKPSFFTKSPEDGLEEALGYYGVHHPEIVYAQAVLETGNFKSDLCINGNNLFGLYNSRDNEYYTYTHWSESVRDYVNFIQYKYKPPNNYYKFLSDIGYAEDPNYIKKLKGIVSRNDKKNLK